jgi:hypothetical protein
MSPGKGPQAVRRQNLAPLIAENGSSWQMGIPLLRPAEPFRMFNRFACSIGFASCGLVEWLNGQLSQLT